MKVQYDPAVDALYLELGTQAPDGVVEVAAGVHIDTTGRGEIVGIEILNASEKINIDTLLTYTLDFDPGIMRPVAKAPARRDDRPERSPT